MRIWKQALGLRTCACKNHEYRSKQHNSQGVSLSREGRSLRVGSLLGSTARS